MIQQTTDNNSVESGENLASIQTEQSDLLLFISEYKQGENKEISFFLHAQDTKLELSYKNCGSISLKKEPLHFFRSFFREIENIPLDDLTEEKLERIGAHLFETVLPENLQSLLWKLKDRIQSIHIYSDDPWIPWELCRLQGEDENAMINESGFLCETFIVTRWIRDIPRYSSFTLNNMALIVPTDSGLHNANKERNYLSKLSTETRKVTLVDADFSSVIKALSSGQYDSWHFTGHGLYQMSDPNRSGIRLDHQEQLCARDISGKVKNLGRSHPLIFLNTCQAGRSGLSLTNIGGFASQSLNAGAGAFIGAYWSIYDHAAYPFAKAFYDRLLAGQPIGKAVREARLEIKRSGDPTWLAYTVYADPFAVVE